MCNRKYSVIYDQGVKNLAGCMGQQVQSGTNVYVMMGFNTHWGGGGLCFLYTLF